MTTVAELTTVSEDGGIADLQDISGNNKAKADSGTGRPYTHGKLIKYM